MLLIKNGNVHTGLGTVLNHFDILVNGSIISKIGKDLNPTQCEIIDAEGKEVFPGFIDPVTIMGCHDGRMFDNNETTDPISPDLEVCYAVERDHLVLQAFYEAGITTVGIGPWNTNILGGQMSIYKTFGPSAKSMMVKRSCILKGSVTDLVKKTYGTKNKPPMTKMGLFALLDKALIEAEEYHPEKGETAKDYKKEAVKKMLSGEFPLFMAANTATEINSLLDVLGNRNIRLTLTNAYQAPQCARQIIDRNIHIVLGDQEVFGDWNNDIDYPGFIRMHEHGVNISLSVTSDNRFSGKEAYMWCVANMHRAGLPEEEVIKMMTINPAKTLDLDKVLGSIEEGKRADLVIYSAHPVKTYQARAVKTIIDGKVVFDRE